MAEVRQRTKAAEPTVAPKEPSSTNTTKPNKKSSGFSFTDVLRILGGILLLNCALSYFVTSSSLTWGWRPWYSKPAMVASWLVYLHPTTPPRNKPLTENKQRGPVYLTDEELKAYDGSDSSKPVYIALNGTIYDVTAGRQVYGPGGSYNFFAGRDATRAFITGCFQEDLTPDIRGAELTYVPVDDDTPSRAEFKKRRERDTRLAKKRVHDTIEGWSRMFKGQAGKNYFEVGKVKREEGWLERLPKRQLCEQAQKQRPQRKA
ncbi:unnamed protein product [Aureobasidium uvarum]|uniref:Cytochrome b5 heme-binding domain-containing protein n=1 Tax=Aureobasidium uvarum TaxID=2773716 RepID=A0A9N8PTA4_9PEZI|nr:unnamed protein product [Aureobasidium uvarum]